MNKIAYLQYILNSYEQLTGKSILSSRISPQEDFDEVNKQNFVLVAHDGQPDPVFNFANQFALNLWEMTWDEFTSLHSRKSAEPQLRAERAELLKNVEKNGFYDQYSGVRISKYGKRFLIKNATVFNVYNDLNVKIGQAAYFKEIEPVSD